MILPDRDSDTQKAATYAILNTLLAGDPWRVPTDGPLTLALATPESLRREVADEVYLFATTELSSMGDSRNPWGTTDNHSPVSGYRLDLEEKLNEAWELEQDEATHEDQMIQKAKAIATATGSISATYVEEYRNDDGSLSTISATWTREEVPTID